MMFNSSRYNSISKYFRIVTAILFGVSTCQLIGQNYNSIEFDYQFPFVEILEIEFVGDLAYMATSGGIIIRDLDGNFVEKIESAKNWFDQGAIRDVEIDAEGNIWVLNRLGIFRYELNTWIKYASHSDFYVEINGITWTNNIHSIFADSRGDVWANIHYGVAKFTGSNFERVDYGFQSACASDLAQVNEDNQGNLVIVNPCELIFHNGITFSSIQKPPYIGDLIHVDEANVLYFTTGSKEIWKYDGSNWLFHFEFTMNPPVYSIAVDTFDNWYLAGRNGSIQKYDWNELSFLPNPIQASPGGDVNLLEIDKNNNIWLGSRGDYSRTHWGIYHFSGTEWKNYIQTDDFLDMAVHQPLTDEMHRLWLPSILGMIKDSSGVRELVTFGNEYNDNIIQDQILDHMGNLWVAHGGMNGISKFNGIEWTDYEAQAIKLQEDTLGIVWGLSPPDLIFFNGNEFENYSIDALGISFFGDTIKPELIEDFLIADNNDKWIAASDCYGIHHLDGVSWHNYSHENELSMVNPFRKHLGKNRKNEIFVGNGQPSAYLGGMYENRDWVDYYDGAHWNSFRVWEDLLWGADGLDQQAAYSFFEDSKGTFWIGTEKGLLNYSDSMCVYYEIGRVQEIEELRTYNDSLLLGLTVDHNLNSGKIPTTVYARIDYRDLSSTSGTFLDKKWNVSVYPNPYFDEIKVALHLEKSGHLKIELIDTNGVKTKDLYDGQSTAGEQNFNFNDFNLSNKMYFLKVSLLDEGLVKIVKIVHNK